MSQEEGQIANYVIVKQTTFHFNRNGNLIYLIQALLEK